MIGCRGHYARGRRLQPAWLNGFPIPAIDQAAIPLLSEIFPRPAGWGFW